MKENCIMKVFENLKTLKTVVSKFVNINVMTTKGNDSPVINGDNNVYKK
jgi:hypothetical protein